MKQQPIRKYDLIFIIPHMGPGGSQRVASLILNYWAQRGMKICIVTLFDKGSEVYHLDRTIDRVEIYRPSYVPSLRSRDHKSKTRYVSKFIDSIVALTAKNYFRNILRQIHKLPFDKLPISNLAYINFTRKYLLCILGRNTAKRVTALQSLFRNTHHKAVLSFLGATNIQTVIAGYGIASHLVISERNDPRLQQLAPPWENLRKRLYTLADKVTANSQGAIESLKGYVAPEKLVYVPNPVKPFQQITESPLDRNKSILAVGRLVEQKGIDLLINAFAMIADQIPDWTLDLVGDGPLKDELETLSHAKGIGSKVIFHGYQNYVHPFYQSASIYALPSRFEGTPNSLLEAICYGLPSVVSDASPGPLEHIEHGNNGFVFKSEDAKHLGSMLLKLAHNKILWHQMQEASQIRASCYDLESVVKIWENVLFDNNNLGFHGSTAKNRQYL